MWESVKQESYMDTFNALECFGTVLKERIPINNPHLVAYEEDGVARVACCAVTRAHDLRAGLGSPAHVPREMRLVYDYFAAAALYSLLMMYLSHNRE